MVHSDALFSPRLQLLDSKGKLVRALPRDSHFPRRFALPRFEAASG
jgi:hypothetical protein